MVSNFANVSSEHLTPLTEVHMLATVSTGILQLAKGEYCICDCVVDCDSSDLPFHKGDLIVLDNDYQNRDICTGICQRTGRLGQFPSEDVHVLPTMVQPNVHTLVSGPDTFIFVESEEHFLLNINLYDVFTE